MSCQTEITPGTILGNLKTSFEGSIQDFLKNHLVSEEKAQNYENASFCPVEVYHGIPYAEPPVDENAYKKTKKFSGQFEGGVKDCKNYGKVAIQDPMWAMMMSVSQLAAHVDFESAYKASQDCLTLDIYKPQVEGDVKLQKVMQGMIQANSTASIFTRDNSQKDFLKKYHFNFLPTRVRLDPRGFVQRRLSDRIQR